MKQIGGVITALATPFKDGKVDKDSYRKLISQQLKLGIDGLVVNGTTGESPTVTWLEVKELFELAQTETSGRIPLIVGTGSNSTTKSCEFSKEAASWGADAVLVVVPYYNRPPQRGLLEHFKAVALSSSAPVLLYNVPSRTVATLEAPTIHELSREGNIIGVKEATGNLQLLSDIAKGAADGFRFLSGDDASCVDFCAQGGQGVISVCSHLIGKDMKTYIQGAHSGDKKAAGEFRARYRELLKWLYIEANPIPLKMALHWMGIFDSAELRLPLVSLDKKFHKDFQACLKELHLI